MKGMAAQILLLLMVVRACLSASIQTSYNEIVSISMPHDLVSDDDTDTERGRVADIIKPRALTSVRSDAKSSQMDCENDDDCPQNQYCYETQVCAACYECSVYFRYPSTSGCAKTPQMCGSCENGYHNEILSGGKVRDTCARISTFQPETIFAGTTWNSPHMWLFGAFVVMGLFVAIGLLAVWSGGMGKKWVQKMFWRAGNGTYQVYSVPSAPPLPSKDCDIGRHCVEEPLVSQYEREKIVATKAVPFDTSEMPKGVTWQNTDHGNHAQSFGEASGYQHTGAVGPSPLGPSPPQLEDDSTIPSTWTPETLSEGALVTSFTGLFSDSEASGNFNNNNEFSNSQNFNDSEANSNTSSAGSEGSSNTSNNTSAIGGPVHIFVQGGPGQSSVECRVMVNNIQINEF